MQHRLAFFFTIAHLHLIAPQSFSLALFGAFR
jgi:hypothetical protein